jgi:thioesterase domain-containing protein/acyl carrier protein
MAVDGHRLARLLKRSGATVMQATPATWRLLLAAGWKGNSKFKILCGGEAWSQELAEPLLARCGSLWNMYGPTETTIWSAATRVLPGQPVFISGPIGNTRLYIVDRFLQLAPVGVAGELCIAGEGLARGYWNRPELTAEKFLPDPFSHEPAARLYRTGDLARYRADGSIEFLGRIDHQVKLRGFRVELGEIESVLSEYPGVRQVVVVLREDSPGDQRLVAYLVQSSRDPATHAELRAWVRAKLPEYMMPADFVLMDALPLTPNGKIDRKALPSSALERFEFARAIVGPRDALEQQLVGIWENILQVRRVRPSDNFFDLGGHSLTAVRLFSEIRKRTGRDLPLDTLFQAPTIRELADILRRDGWSPPWSSLVPIQPGGSKPPFFCVHGRGGDILLYRNLARHLGSDYPFFGLQSQGLDGKGKYLTTIEEMATHYVREVRNLQHDGPYYLGGFGMGGAVAYQMAQDLLDQGQEIRLLALFDSYNHNGRTSSSSGNKFFSLSETIYFHWANMAPLGLRGHARYLAQKVGEVGRRERERLWVKVANLAHRRDSDGNRLVRRFLEDVNAQASFSYRPKPYSGKLTLFKPRENYTPSSDPSREWSKFALGGLEIITLPVHPGGMFVEPYVIALADKLRGCIDAGQKSEQPFSVYD